MITVVGESLIDVFVDPEGDAHEEVGGSPMNVAVALARLDVTTHLITETGHDERGGQVVRHVTASGVELLSAPSVNGRASTATVRLDDEGIAGYEFDVTWTLPHQELPACDALHVGSLGAFLEPGRDSVLDLVEQAWARNVFVSYDPNLRAELVEDPYALWRDVESLADRATLVKLSTEDIGLLHSGADPADIARSLLTGERTELVLLTRGSAGATAFVDGCSVDLPAEPVEVIDTVGAGDAFMAGALAVLLESDAMNDFGGGLPRDEAGLARLLRGASQVAAITCSRRGANPPLRSDLPHAWPD